LVSALPEKSKHLTFRLPASHAGRLDARAGALGLSAGQLARLVVVQSLEGGTEAALAAEFERLIAEVRELREEILVSREKFALAVETLLTHAGRCPEQHAEAWVRENLS
jgi:hypothetical protein